LGSTKSEDVDLKTELAIYKRIMEDFEREFELVQLKYEEVGRELRIMAKKYQQLKDGYKRIEKELPTS
jgi:archaellum component FlaC